MERKELIKKIKTEVDIRYEYFKDKIINQNLEDFCEEMALMYNLRKFLEYIEYNTETFTDKDLQLIVDNNVFIFLETFLDIFWNSNLGTSFTDIQNIIRGSIEKLKMSLGGVDYE